MYLSRSATSVVRDYKLYILVFQKLINTQKLVKSDLKSFDIVIPNISSNHNTYQHHLFNISLFCPNKPPTIWCPTIRCFYQSKLWIVVLILFNLPLDKTLQCIILLSILVNTVGTGKLIWLGGISLATNKNVFSSTPLNQRLIEDLLPHPLLSLSYTQTHPSAVWKRMGRGVGVMRKRVDMPWK